MLLIMKELYDQNLFEMRGGNEETMMDASTQPSWLDTNIKKTLSYFNLNLPTNFTSVLGNSTTSSNICSFENKQ